MVTRGQRVTQIAAAALAAAAAACGGGVPAGPTAPSPTATTVPIMGAARLSAAQLVAWFNGRQPRPPGLYAATVPVETLAQLYIEEGAAEGVTGDVAFTQGIVEAGWFRFRWATGTGRLQPPTRPRSSPSTTRPRGSTESGSPGRTRPPARSRSRPGELAG